MASRWRSARWLGALLGVAVVSCSQKPVAVLTGLEIVVAEGDDQYGTLGQILTTPLRAVVRVTATQEPQEDISVRWEIERGGATLVSSATATSDETGSVEVRVRLGSAPEEVTVRATVVRQPSASVAFTLHTVEPPVLTDVDPASVEAGDTVTLTGSNFSPTADQNVVLFSGIRGRVLTASGSELAVEVPSCLPARDVGVSVQLGTIASDFLTLAVTGGSVATPLSVGQVLDVADDAGLECHLLAGAVGAQYLTVVYSASTVGAATHPFELTALSSSGPLPGPARVPGVPELPVAREEVRDPQAEWDERLRTREGELIARGRSTVRVGSQPARVAPAAVPTVGETRRFKVWTGTSEFADVTAVAQYVGTKAAIFVDQDAPAGGFTPTDLAAFAAQFDDVIYPEVTAIFGMPSDLDQNERVIILFTPVVNSLTPRGSSGLIGGFFYGIDLLPENANSNAAEVFYALVPDPTGIYSDRRETEDVLNVVPAVLAHEFQHMVQFNQRYLRLDAGQEALWLSEALAQMAEELVARRYDELGQAGEAERFRGGVKSRAARYLTDTDAVSLIVSTGQGSLAERGAGFLHLLYLSDHEGVDLLGRLSTTTRTGVANVEAEVDADWPDILSDWWGATYLDGVPGPWTGRLVYPNVDLRGYVAAPFPLVPEPLGPGSTTESGLLWSSSAIYYLMSPDAAGSLTVRLGGEAGGTSSTHAAMRLRIVRVS